LEKAAAFGVASTWSMGSIWVGGEKERGRREGVPSMRHALEFFSGHADTIRVRGKKQKRGIGEREGFMARTGCRFPPRAAWRFPQGGKKKNGEGGEGKGESDAHFSISIDIAL